MSRLPASSGSYAPDRGGVAGTRTHYRHDPMAVLLALLAAVGYAVASVLQHRAARDQPDELALRPGLLWRLVRRPEL